MVISLSNLALKHLVEELKILENGFVNKVQTLENGWIKMKIHTKQGGKDLIFTPNAIFISEYLIPAKPTPGGYSALLKKYLFNQRVEKIEQNGLDRLLIFSFPTHYLIIELFAKGNLILTDKNWKIIKAMKKEEWKDRKLEIGEKYKNPSSKGHNPLIVPAKKFIEEFLENKKTCFGACVDLLNISPTILEKNFLELGFDKQKNAIDFSEKDAKKLFEKIKTEYSQKSGKISLLKDTIYSTDLKIPVENTFETINSALNELLVKKISQEKTPSKKNIKKQDNFEQVLIEKKQQIKELEKQEKIYKKIGEEIYLKYSLITDTINAIKRGEEKGLHADKIKEKINNIQTIIEKIDLKNKKVEINI
jgi:predicted ribosome quality control (RQC) complex YloA/Tae2 family protein